MHRSTTPYWWGAVVRFRGDDWVVLGVTEDKRLLRKLGTNVTRRVTVATLKLYNA